MIKTVVTNSMIPVNLSERNIKIALICVVKLVIPKSKTAITMLNLYIGIKYLLPDG